MSRPSHLKNDAFIFNLSKTAVDKFQKNVFFTIATA